MNLIMQPTSSTCGQACIAMTTEKRLKKGIALDIIYMRNYCISLIILFLQRQYDSRQHAVGCWLV